MKSTVVAVLVAVALGLAGGGSTLAAGKMGGASGMDNLVISLSVDDQFDAGNEVGDRPTTQGGKIGDGTNSVGD